MPHRYGFRLAADGAYGGIRSSQTLKNVLHHGRYPGAEYHSRDRRGRRLAMIAARYRPDYDGRE